MKFGVKYSLLLGITLFLFTAVGYTQQRTIFKGKVVEKSSGLPVAFATVMVADNAT